MIEYVCIYRLESSSQHKRYDLEFGCFPLANLARDPEQERARCTVELSMQICNAVEIILPADVYAEGLQGLCVFSDYILIYSRHFDFSVLGNRELIQPTSQELDSV